MHITATRGSKYNIILDDRFTHGEFVQREDGKESIRFTRRFLGWANVVTLLETDVPQGVAPRAHIDIEPVFLDGGGLVATESEVAAEAPSGCGWTLERLVKLQRPRRQAYAVVG
jgi:hypothetical protein